VLSVVVVGLHERDAPLDLLERVAVPQRELSKALSLLGDSPHLSETVLLSTCMRTEVYAVVERFHDGLADIEAFFSARAGGSSGAAIADQLVVSYDEAASQHLFEVASGIDSAVLGEGEILRQVREAGDVARDERASGPVLAGLFRHAIVVGKRVRSETGIARGVTSLAHVAVARAAAECGGSLSGRTILVIGAGQMGAEMGRALEGTGYASVVVASRDVAHAAAVAAPLGGRAVDLSALADELAGADVVLSATAADEVVVDLETVRRAREIQGTRSLVLVDVALPRDIDPAVAELPGVAHFDLPDLRAFVERERKARSAEISSAREIISEELENYRLDTRARAAAPLVTALRERAEDVRSAELARIERRLSALDDKDRELVEQLSRRLVAKLIHEPTTQVKLAAGTARGERLAEALRILYDL
jgi:glutamyl-tRNA reductase